MSSQLLGTFQRLVWISGPHNTYRQIIYFTLIQWGRCNCRAHWLSLVWPYSLLSTQNNPLLSGAAHYTRWKRPNSTDDICIFLLDIILLYSYTTRYLNFSVRSQNSLQCRCGLLWHYKLYENSAKWRHPQGFSWGKHSICTYAFIMLFVKCTKSISYKLQWPWGTEGPFFV